MRRRLPPSIYKAVSGSNEFMSLVQWLYIIDKPLDEALRKDMCLFALCNFTALKTQPTFEAFDCVANILNLVALSIAERPDLLHYFRVLQSAALAMEDIRKRSEQLGRVEMRMLEAQSIVNAIIRFDEILPCITYRTLKLSLRTLES